MPGAINGAAALVVQDESSHGEQGVPAGHAPAQTGTCQGCHMPLVRSDDPAAHDGLYTATDSLAAIPPFQL